MEIPKQQILSMIESRMGGDQAAQASAQLPDQVDHEHHAGLLQQFGIDPQEALNQLGGAGGSQGGFGGEGQGGFGGERQGGFGGGEPGQGGFGGEGQGGFGGGEPGQGGFGGEGQGGFGGGEPGQREFGREGQAGYGGDPAQGGGLAGDPDQY